jgi:isocitrate/isopropylmalate dehydrogenase
MHQFLSSSTQKYMQVPHVNVRNSCQTLNQNLNVYTNVSENTPISNFTKTLSNLELLMCREREGQLDMTKLIRVLLQPYIMKTQYIYIYIYI